MDLLDEKLSLSTGRLNVIDFCLFKRSTMKYKLKYWYHMCLDMKPSSIKKNYKLCVLLDY